MKLKLLSLTLLIALLAPVLPAHADGPLPAGYAREMNEWYDVCDKDSLDPDSPSFEPDEDFNWEPEPVRPHEGAFFQIEDLNDQYNPFYLLFYYFDIAPIPPALAQEQILDDYITRNGKQCIWNAYVEMEALSGEQLAKTPRKDFNHNVEFGDVSFMFYYDDLELIGVFQYRPYKIVTLWDDGLQTVEEGSIDTSLEEFQTVIPSVDDPAYHAVAGYVSHTISPRPNHTISAIWLEFEYPGIVDWGAWTGVIPAPTLLIDKILIRGFYRTNPLPTATPTRTPAPGVPTATPTARPSLWATPTATAVTTPTMTITPLATKQLPAKYSFVPTSIPAVKLPSWPPVATMAPIPTPATPISLALIPTPSFPSHSWVPAPGEPTPTPLAWTTDVVSFTSWLSASTNINGTDTFTVASAPGWYAPSLPRPLADVGWTFETMQGGIATGQRYSLAAWAALAGYLASLPIQLIKSVMDLFRFMGPFGLFVGWLLIMLPGVLFFKVFEFFKSLVIRLFNFIFDMIRFILELIKLIPFV